MTLGLPGHLARDSLSRAFVHAGHCAAWVCLGVGVVIGTVGAIGGDLTAGSSAALAAMLAVLLIFVAWYPNVAFTVLYLVAGTGVVFIVTVFMMDSAPRFESTNNVVLALPLVALLLVGGAGSGPVIAITWATLGFGLGEAAAFLGATLVGAQWSPNLAATAAFAIVVIARVFDGVTPSSVSRRETGLHRASQRTREFAIRHDYELRATARLHDTALSHLIAIAAAGSGPVDERLREGIRQDLGLIVGRDWASEHGPSEDGVDQQNSFAAAQTTDAASVPHRLENALEVAANAGLDVRMSGDLASLGALSPSRAEALDAAVAQCLINVARHARVRKVELVLGLGAGEVTVAVMDNGVGFDEREVPEDRIGLRTSIRARIEQQGGAVRLWSTKGVGTTVLLTLPEGDG